MSGFQLSSTPRSDSSRVGLLRLSGLGWILLVIVTACWMTGARHAPETQRPIESGPVADLSDPDKLYKRIHRLAHRSLDIIDRTIEMGAPVQDAVNRVIRCSWDLLVTDLYASQDPKEPRSALPEVYFAQARGAPNPDRVRSFEENVIRLRDWESRFRKQFDRGFISELDFNSMQIARLEAEALLARELHKPQ